jgi:putative ABC transport system permease protein
MFDIDKWQEIFATINKNRTRTVLTGFSVAWGIFMLIILLGSGRGLQNGVSRQFAGSVNNAIWISGGQTGVAYQGMQPGRNVVFNNQDYEALKKAIPEIDRFATRYWMRGSNTVNYKNKWGAFNLQLSHPDYGYIKDLKIIEGRFLNQADFDESRKSVTIGKAVRSALFKDASPLGEYIEINGFAFKVVGVFKDQDNDNLENRIYMPISTAQKVFNGGDQINQFVITVNGSKESKAVIEKIRHYLAKKHQFDYKDDRAIEIWDKAEEVKKFEGLFTGISVFVWIIGIGTIIAGVVGVSNIMMIVVKERTKEIGIRKALGATPGSIVSMILLESIIITGFAGYVGLVLGVGLLELLSPYVQSDFFLEPQADFNIAVSATILLVIAGSFAGFIPSRRAAGIKPIEALRDE